MRRSGRVVTVLACVLSLAASPAPPEVGERIEVQVAERYITTWLSVEPGRIGLPGLPVQEDADSITVMPSPGAPEAHRYARSGVRLTGTVSARDGDSVLLNLDLDPGPPVRIPVGAIVTWKTLRREPAPPLEPGAKVRLRAAELGGAAVIGRIVHADDEGLRIAMPARAEPVDLRWSSIQGVEVAVRGTRAREGRRVGGLVGAAVGIGLGVAMLSQGDFSECYAGCELVLLAAGGLGVAGWGLGLGMGAAVGETMKTEEWAPAAPQRVRLRVAPAGRHGVGASVSIRF